MKKNVSLRGGLGRPLGGFGVALAALCLGLAAAHAPQHAPVRNVQRGTPVPAATYTNPVVGLNFPDPSVLRDGGAYYAYATNSGPNMPCVRSTDLVHWTVQHDAMPMLPPWAQEGRTWAPVVCKFGPNRYVAYFCAHARAGDTQAIGFAVGTSPDGPFTSDAAAPLIERTEMGGEIDPSVFTDSDGGRYLVWKNDGNSKGKDTWLWLQKLSADGLNLVGEPTQLVKQNQAWEGPLVEAPTLWKHGGKYYLFYSANGYGGCGYAIGYAVADSLRGPYTKPETTPWVASTPDVCGPGGQDVLAGPDGQTWMVYHMWANGPHSYRSMSLDPLTWEGGVPHLVGPSRQPVAAPRLSASRK